jgi:hypothetical protein
MPALGPHHQAGVPGAGLGLLDRLLPDQLLDALALAVDVVQRLSQPLARGLVGGQQQIQGQLGLAQAAGRVQPAG